MDNFTVIIESPKGSGHKFDYEPQENRFKLKKIMPVGLVFPFDFGFIPHTRGEDGDPLDVVVVSEISSFPGCSMDCRIIGALQVKQTELDGQTMRKDRYFAVPEVTHLFCNLNNIDDLPEDVIDQVAYFFKNYNDQAGKNLEVTGRINSEEAIRMIKENMQ